MKLTALMEGVTVWAKPGDFRLGFGTSRLKIINDGEFITESRVALTLLRDACIEALTGWPENDDEEDAQ